MYFSNFDFINNNLTEEFLLQKCPLPRRQMDEIEQAFMYNFLLNVVKPSKAMEWGTDTGCSTRLIAEAMIESLVEKDYVISYEVHESLANSSTSYIKNNNLDDFVKIVQGDLFKVIDKDKICELDFLFIDCNHDEPFVSRYAEELLPLLKNGCWIMAHDIRYNVDNLNPESIVLKKYITENKIETYFWIPDVMEHFEIKQPAHRDWCYNPSFWFRIEK